MGVRGTLLALFAAGQRPQPAAAGAEAATHGAHALLALGALEGALGDPRVSRQRQDEPRRQYLAVGEDGTQERARLLLGARFVGGRSGGEEVVGGQWAASLPAELRGQPVGQRRALRREVGLDVDQGVAGSVLGAGTGSITERAAAVKSMLPCPA
jgi:hypothetical protein